MIEGGCPQFCLRYKTFLPRILKHANKIRFYILRIIEENNVNKKQIASKERRENIL